MKINIQAIENFAISPQLLHLIGEIDRFNLTWQNMNSLSPEILTSLKQVATVESVASSTRIEGSKLSNEEVDRLLMNLEVRSFKTRDEQEVAGYAAAMETVIANYKVIPLNENYIRQLHSLLLQYSDKDERHHGQYKKLNNHVEAFGLDGTSLGVVFQTSTPFATPEDMRLLVDWMQRAMADPLIHPLLSISAFIVSFLAIHPFQDGNGRLSRILTNLLLLKAGYHYVPYSSLESVIEQKKESYYFNLRKTQASLGEEEVLWQPWVHFHLRCLSAQKDRLHHKISSFGQQDLAMPALAEKLLHLTHMQCRVSVSDLVKLTGENRNTIKKHLSYLVASKKLIQHGKGRGTFYVKN